MSLGLILLIVVVIFLIGAAPSWGYSRNWGYRPMGGIGIILIILILLFLFGGLHF